MSTRLPQNSILSVKAKRDKEHDGKVNTLILTIVYSLFNSISWKGQKKVVYNYLHGRYLQLGTLLYCYWDCLKKNLNASKLSEHLPQTGGSIKTFRWEHRLPRQNLFIMITGWILTREHNYVRIRSINQYIEPQRKA